MARVTSTSKNSGSGSGRGSRGSILLSKEKKKKGEQKKRGEEEEREQVALSHAWIQQVRVAVSVNLLVRCLHMPRDSPHRGEKSRDRREREELRDAEEQMAKRMPGSRGKLTERKRGKERERRGERGPLISPQGYI